MRPQFTCFSSTQVQILTPICSKGCNPGPAHVPKERCPARALFSLSTHLLRNSRGRACSMLMPVQCSKQAQKESMKKKERHICMAQEFPIAHLFRSVGKI